MPIYEYRCGNCKHRVSIFFRSFADTDKGDTPFVVTTDCGYLRLRRTNYDDRELTKWVERIASQRLTRAYVYFKHEDEALGPKFARRFNELWRNAHSSPNTEAL